MGEAPGADSAAARRWVCPPEVGWVVETARIVVVHRGTGAAHSLEYPEAAVWDLLSRGYSCERTISMLCAIASLEPRAAEQCVLAAIESWAGSGILVETGDHG